MNTILRYKEYYADVHFSGEDKVFYGKIIDINDLVNFESASLKGLKKSFKEAVEDYLEICNDLKLKITKREISK